METDAPLSGKKVLITRTKAQAASFAAKISELGGTAIKLPLIVTKAPVASAKVDQVIRQIASFDWIVFTSTNGVAYFFAALQNNGYDSNLLKTKKVAAVGKKTAQYLENRDIPVSIQPDEFVAEALLEVLLKEVRQTEKVLIPKGNLARDVIEKGLLEKDIHVESAVVYETTTNYTESEKLKDYLNYGELDIITFTSPSTVHAFMELISGEKINHLKEVVFACIGPITEKAIKEYPHGPLVVAREFTVDGLIKQLLAYYEGEI